MQTLFGARHAATAEDPAQVQAAAARGVATPATALPHRSALQHLFGRHDLSGIQAHVGGEAAASARAIGADAYATGDHVVLDHGADLFTVAHEAAHVVQQRGGVAGSGGVSAPGDPHERHADEVAGRAVRGEPVEALLDRHAPSGDPGDRHHGAPIAAVSPMSHTQALVQRQHKNSPPGQDTGPSAGGASTASPGTHRDQVAAGPASPASTATIPTIHWSWLGGTPGRGQPDDTHQGGDRGEEEEGEASPASTATIPTIHWSWFGGTPDRGQPDDTHQGPEGGENKGKEKEKGAEMAWERAEVPSAPDPTGGGGPGQPRRAGGRGRKQTPADRWNHIAEIWQPGWHTDDPPERPTRDGQSDPAWESKFIAGAHGAVVRIHVARRAVLLSALAPPVAGVLVKQPEALLENNTFRKISASVLHPKKTRSDDSTYDERPVGLILSASEQAIALACNDDLNSPKSGRASDEQAREYIQLVRQIRNVADRVRALHARMYTCMRGTPGGLEHRPVAELLADHRTPLAAREKLELRGGELQGQLQRLCESWFSAPVTESQTAGRGAAFLEDDGEAARSQHDQLLQNMAKAEPLQTMMELLDEYARNPILAGQDEARRELVTALFEICQTCHALCQPGGELEPLILSDHAERGPRHWQSLKGPGMLAATSSGYNEVIVDLDSPVEVTGLVLLQDSDQLLRLLADTAEAAGGEPAVMAAHEFWRAHEPLWSLVEGSFTANRPLPLVVVPDLAGPGSVEPDRSDDRVHEAGGVD